MAATLSVGHITGAAALPLSELDLTTAVLGGRDVWTGAAPPSSPMVQIRRTLMTGVTPPEQLPLGKKLCRDAGSSCH